MTTVEATGASIASALSGSSSNASASSQAKDKAASDFQSFLSLLTAQLQNQDPLSPLDSTQFVEQLASFSAVEQQIATNSLLEKMVSSSEVTGLEGATQWIGREVDAPVSQFKYEGEPVEFSLPQSADGVASEVVVHSASGAIISQAQLSAGATKYVFDGKRADGTAIAEGRYEIMVNYTDEEGAVTGVEYPHTSSKVVEAQLDDGTLMLKLENGASITPDKIAAVRVASDGDNQSTEPSDDTSTDPAIET